MKTSDEVSPSMSAGSLSSNRSALNPMQSEKRQSSSVINQYPDVEESGSIDVIPAEKSD